MFAVWNGVLIGCDLWRRRVPNVWVAAGLCAQALWLLAALLVQGWAYPPSWPGWAQAAAGVLFPAAFLPLWRRRLMGAGDIKAMAVIGLALGLAPLALTLLFASLLAGLHSLAWRTVPAVRAAPRSAQIPYAAYLGAAALSAACIPSNSAWYSWCSSWCSTGS